MRIDTVVFDLGGVLIDWNPRYLYRKLMNNDVEKIEYFLSNICTKDWNAQMDAELSFEEGVKRLKTQYPDYSTLIEAYDESWDQMLGGAKWDVVRILEELKRKNFRLLSLTNWSAEKFPIARNRYPFLNHFEDILVSGNIGLKKPDKKFYCFFLEKYNLKKENILFIDDVEENILSANEVGIPTIHFRNAAQLRVSLNELGLI